MTGLYLSNLTKNHMQYHAEITIMPLKALLDPQGKAVAGGLRQLGFDIEDVRVGRELVLDIPTNDQKQALEIAQEMCRKLLANPVTEDYRLEAGE